MSGRLQVDTIQSENGSNGISISNMQRRVIQRTSQTYRSGYWRADNSYYWIPGMFVEFRPLRSDSRISLSFSIPTRDYGSAHMIMHYIMYIDDQEQMRFTRGGHHVENAHAIDWEIPSWGAGQFRRVGMKARSYSEGNHNAHLYMLRYWNGGGNSLRVPGQLIMEEYTPAPT